MNTELAFAMGEMNRGKELMVFDWDKAATIIRDRKPDYADAYLDHDREWTGGNIYKDGMPNYESYTYLASTWATPMLEIDGDSIECFKMQHEVPEWGNGTKWPKSALNILNGDCI